MVCVGLEAACPYVDHPHHDASGKHRDGNHCQTAQVFITPLLEQQGRNGSADEGEKSQRNGMREPSLVAALAFGERVKELNDAFQVEEQQGEDGACLNHDRIHLPVGIIERNMHQRLRDAEVRRRTDRQKLCQTFNDAEQDRLNIYVQKASGVQLLIASVRRNFAALSRGRFRKRVRPGRVCRQGPLPATCNTTEEICPSTLLPGRAYDYALRPASYRRHRRHTCLRVPPGGRPLRRGPSPHAGCQDVLPRISRRFPLPFPGILSSPASHHRVCCRLSHTLPDLPGAYEGRVSRPSLDYLRPSGCACTDHVPWPMAG